MRLAWVVVRIAQVLTLRRDLLESHLLWLHHSAAVALLPLLQWRRRRRWRQQQLSTVALMLPSVAPNLTGATTAAVPSPLLLVRPWQLPCWLLDFPPSPPLLQQYPLPKQS